MNLKLLACAIALLATFGALADTTKVNGSISIAAGQQDGNLNTVNGAISVGDKAAVGEVQTVNGAVRVGDGATAKEATTVNGKIDIGAGARITGDVTVVNGSILLNRAADVAGDVSSVNGNINMAGAHVAGDIETANGSIDVGADSRVDGGIRIRKPRGSWSINNSRPPTVVIGPRSVVKGALEFERAVKLYVSNSASTGTIKGAQAIKFSGDSPPRQ